MVRAIQQASIRAISMRSSNVVILYRGLYPHSFGIVLMPNYWSVDYNIITFAFNLDDGHICFATSHLYGYNRSYIIIRDKERATIAIVYYCSQCEHIYTTKIDEFVCPPNIPETVSVRIMKLAHRPRIVSTTIKLISKPILLSIFINFSKKNNSANLRWPAAQFVAAICARASEGSFRNN